MRLSQRQRETLRRINAASDGLFRQNKIDGPPVYVLRDGLQTERIGARTVKALYDRGLIEVSVVDFESGRTYFEVTSLGRDPLVVTA